MYVCIHICIYTNILHSTKLWWIVVDLKTFWWWKYIDRLNALHSKSDRLKFAGG